jgi:ATP-binding cassette, subfamily G (WHITE), member 2, SNQ2
VVQRNNMALWRSPEYIFSRLFVASLISFFISLSFLQLGVSLRDLQFRVFAMYVPSTPLFKCSLNMISRFWVVVLPALVMAQIEPLFLMNRSASISRIVIDILMLLLGIFFRGTFSVKFRNPLFNSPLH